MSDKRNSVGVENPPPELHETNSHSIAKPALETVTGDAALNFLENHEAIAYTREEEKVIIRKIDRVLMPLMFVSYTIQFMDKNVLTQAAIYDLIPDLGLKGQDYSWCSSMFYFGYLAFQPLAARLLAYCPLGRFVAFISLMWAVLLFCTAGASNFSGMMALRFLLGMAEGGISPAYVLITGMWYKKDEIPLRITLWYCGNGCAIILQSFVSYGIGHINNTGIAVWKWFFIIFGLVGLIWAVVLWVFMPDTILSAKFLTEREKMIAVERLRENRTGISSQKFKKDQLFEAFTDIKVWYGFFYSIACVVPTTAVGSFGGLIIKGFGYDSFKTSLLNCPLGVTQIMGLLATGFVTYNFPNTRCLMQFVCNVPAVIGATLVYVLPKSNSIGRLISFYCCNFTNGSLPMMFALTTTNIAGHTKRAVASSILFVGYSTAFIIGPQFFLGTEAPTYQTGFKTMIILFSTACLSPGLYYAYVMWTNKRKERKLEETGEAYVHVENEEFFDLTDKQQPRFMYSA